MGLQTKALKFIGENLVEGAKAGIKQEGTKVVTKVAGMILSQIGLGSLIDDPNEEARAAHAETIAAIKSLGGQLTRIEDQLKSMMKEMSAGFSIINEKLGEIHQQQLYTSWQIVDNDVQALISNINTQYRVFVNYAANPATTSKEQIKLLAADITNTNNGAANHMARLHVLVTGEGQRKGVLELWCQMVAPLVLKYKMSFEEATRGYLNYYTSIVYAQMRAATLLVEAHNHYKNSAAAVAEFDKYRKFAKEQELPFLSNVDAFAASALNYAASIPKPQGTSKAVSMDAMLARVSFFAGSTWGWTSPSVWHLEAETILANAAALGADERRIVIWMITRADYVGGMKVPSFDVTQNFQITMSGSSVTRGIPQSYYQEIKRGKLDFQNTDKPNHIKRSVWEATADNKLVDGSYKLESINGQFQPISSYIKGKVYFMHPDYLNFDMTIDKNNQFAFMEFATFADPNKDYTWWSDNVS